MHKYIRAHEIRNSIIKILENLSFDEKKEVLRIVDQSIINSTNNVLANDDPPGKPIKKLPTKFKSELNAKAMQLGRKIFIRAEVNELFKKKRIENIKLIR